MQGDFTRLENKIDKLTDAVTHLARMEERLIAQTQIIGVLSARVESNEKRLRDVEDMLTKWINRGIGAWAIAGGTTTLVAVVKHLG